MKAFSNRTARSRNAQRCTHTCASNAPQRDPLHVRRRQALLSACGGALLSAAPPAWASVAELTTLYGQATPPASYGGYGGNSKESAKYKFDYPSTWKQKTVGKQQKVRSRALRPLLASAHAQHFLAQPSSFAYAARLLHALCLQLDRQRLLCLCPTSA